MFENDKRIVLTLDAGGTNFVFSAIQGLSEIVAPISMAAITDDKDRCLDLLVNGFESVMEKLSANPVAICIAFPGPAVYENGVIGDLPNFPAFRGGVPLGPFLEEVFKIPVFIHNDGNLFAYGEALAGILPKINAELEASNNPRKYQNLLGVTLGTGFGAGVVINNKLLLGDNGCGGDVWIMRNKKYPDMIAEESVSVRALKRVYLELSKDNSPFLTPHDIFNIAEGKQEGNRAAAIHSFEELGEIAAYAIINALHIVDGIVVIGGGLSGAAKYIIPAILKEMRRDIFTFSNEKFNCLQMNVYNLLDEDDRSQFLKNDYELLDIPRSNKKAIYHKQKRIGITITSLGTNKAIYLGAYAFALHKLDEPDSQELFYKVF